jgi:hypothetical protein
MTAGIERLELPQIWADLASKPRMVDLSPWLLIVAAVLFLAEIFERRTGWFGRLRKPAIANQVSSASEPESKPAKRSFVLQKGKAVSKAKSTPTAPTPKPAPASEVSDGDDAVAALRKARERAGRRTNRES